MAWARIDVSFPEHPKVMGLSDAAFRLHVHALCYAGRALTDGVLPLTWLTGGKGRTVPKAAQQLVEAGLWEHADGIYRIHDYLKYQSSRADVEQARADTAGRKRRSRKSQRDKGDVSQRESQCDSTRESQRESQQAVTALTLHHIRKEAAPPRPPTLIRPRNLNAAYEHPRFDVPQAWHDKRVSGLGDGEFGMSNFYKHLTEHIDAHPDEDTEPRFDWLSGHFTAWCKSRKVPIASASDVDDVAATRRKMNAMMSRRGDS